MYKHASAKEVWDIFGAVCRSSVIDTAGVQNDHPSTVTETTDVCLQELERLNKEIETVTHETSSEPTEQLSVKTDKEVIIISSSEEEEELNYSDVDLSDSDPMEECYRIFMEANNEDNGKEQQPSISVGLINVQKPDFNVTPQVLPGKKRVAHEAKLAEQPAAKSSRPQPQILFPLRGPAASQSSVTSKIQQVQQRASMLTSSVKGGQAFLSATCQRMPESQTSAAPPIQTSVSTQPAPLQNAYINYISMATAVIEVGDNLQLILPEGTQRVLAPVCQVHTSTSVNHQAYHPAAFAPVQRCRTTAPVLFPAPARKPFLMPALAHSSQASPNTPQSAGHVAAAAAAAVAAAAKSVPIKRRLKQQCEATKDKVPHDVRQRYVTMFTEEFLKTTANVNDALEKAVAEERAVYNRNDMALYESLKDYTLTEERLIESNYPVQHPEKLGSAALFADNKKGNTDLPGGMETRYSCCEGVMGAPGCQVYKCYTVHGLELSRVTVVNSSLQVVYDTFVRPDNEVIDYNTRFSGISEEDVKGNNTSLREVQETLMSFINADTILIGHSLETDLCALKVISASAIFLFAVVAPWDGGGHIGGLPPPSGPPYKRTLNNLTAEHLRRIIQESAPPKAETAGLDEQHCDKQSNKEKEAQDIQRVILVPGELMRLDPQVLGPFVSHGELDPEYCLIQRIHGSVTVDPGQPHGTLLVP
ncbi:hypothetical protein INR49_017373, partial [Caranx melampygus]